MDYLISTSFLYILLIFSNTLNLKSKINLSETFFISISLIILFSFSVLKLQYLSNTLLINKIFYILLLITLVLVPNLIKNFSKINIKFNLEFIFLYSLIFFLTKDRYYLDQDEVTFWGKAVKELLRNIDYSIFAHHPQGLSIFRYLFVSTNFNEGMTIFSNNIIMISGFFYLFYKRELLFLEKIVLFIIFYILLNNLSFGFLSIYSDPILAVYFACLLKFLYFFSKTKISSQNLNYYISFIIILSTFILIKSSSIVYLAYILVLILIIFVLKNFNSQKLLYFSLIFLFSIFVLSYLGFNYKNNNLILQLISLITDKNNFLNFTKFFFLPIYFSKFGSTVNGIIEVLFDTKYRIYEINVFLIHYILILIPLFFLKFNYKKFIFIAIIFITILHALIIFILKFQIENLHMTALPRYLGILILSNLIFLLSIIAYENFLIYKNYVVIVFLLIMISVTPKKSIGFITPDQIYYKNLKNKIYKENREKISKLSKIKDDYEKITIIHKNGYSDFTNINISGYHSFYHDILVYELYPKQIRIFEFQVYLRSLKKARILNNSISKKNLFVLFDLSKDQILKIDPKLDKFILNTY